MASQNIAMISLEGVQRPIEAATSARVQRQPSAVGTSTVPCVDRGAPRYGAVPYHASQSMAFRQTEHDHYDTDNGGKRIHDQRLVKGWHNL